MSIVKDEELREKGKWAFFVTGFIGVYTLIVKALPPCGTRAPGQRGEWVQKTSPLYSLRQVPWHRLHPLGGRGTFF